MADAKAVVMVLKVDLQCDRCYKKVKKVLCKFFQIRDQIYDDKQNLVIIKVVCCNPEKLRDKICCKGCGVIKSIEIKPPEVPAKPAHPPPPKKPDPPPPQKVDPSPPKKIDPHPPKKVDPPSPQKAADPPPPVKVDPPSLKKVDPPAPKKVDPPLVVAPNPPPVQPVPVNMCVPVPGYPPAYPMGLCAGSAMKGRAGAHVTAGMGDPAHVAMGALLEGPFMIATAEGEPVTLPTADISMKKMGPGVVLCDARGSL